MNRRRADAKVLLHVDFGGRRGVWRWLNAIYWPCLVVKVFAERLTPAIRFSCSSVPRQTEARMNVRYRVELSQTERAELTAYAQGRRVRRCSTSSKGAV